jgi:hypothetical protein
MFRWVGVSGVHRPIEGCGTVWMWCEMRGEYRHAERRRRSFDYASRDETARGSAQDDAFYSYSSLTPQSITHPPTYPPSITCSQAVGRYYVGGVGVFGSAFLCGGHQMVRRIGAMLVWPVVGCGGARL